MRDSSLRKLTVEEYVLEEEKFFQKWNKYMDKKCEINTQEREYIDSLEHGETHSEKADYYFDHCQDVVEKFEKMRKDNDEEYKGFTSIYYTDFYTELTEEFLAKRKQTYPECVDSGTMEHLLSELKNLKGHHFIAGRDDEVFELAFIGVQVDDFYYVGINDKGEYCWYSAVGKPEFID